MLSLRRGYTVTTLSSRCQSVPNTERRCGLRRRANVQRGAYLTRAKRYVRL